MFGNVRDTSNKTERANRSDPFNPARRGSLAPRVEYLAEARVSGSTVALFSLFSGREFLFFLTFVVSVAQIII